MTAVGGVPVIQCSARRDALELAWVAVETGSGEQGRYHVAVSRGEWLLASVGAEPVNFPADVNHRLVQRVAQTGACVTAHDQPATLRHESRNVADVATDDDIAALQRDRAAAGSIALDDDEPATARGGGTIRCVAL